MMNYGFFEVNTMFWKWGGGGGGGGEREREFLIVSCKLSRKTNLGISHNLFAYILLYFYVFLLNPLFLIYTQLPPRPPLPPPSPPKKVGTLQTYKPPSSSQAS